MCISHNIKIRLFYICMVVLCFILIGCSNGDESPNISEDNNSNYIAYSGIDFLNGNYKVKSTIEYNNSDSLDSVLIELIVDAAGNGKGLLSYNNIVYDVYCVNDKLFIEFDDTNTILITDLTAHILPGDLNLYNCDDISKFGFTLDGQKVRSYSYSENNMNINNEYESTRDYMNLPEVGDYFELTMLQLIKYKFEYQQLIPSIDNSNQEEKDKDNIRESFYTESKYGIKIDDQIYSLGDYCNIGTYFNNQIPEGIVPRYIWIKDNKIELLNVSYITTSGRVEFLISDGFVQQIKSTSDFNFMGIYCGMSVKDLESILGINLNKDEKENYKELIEGASISRNNSSDYTIEFDNIMVQILIDTKLKCVSEIHLINGMNLFR